MTINVIHTALIEVPAVESVLVKAEDWALIQTVVRRVMDNDLIVTPVEQEALKGMKVQPLVVEDEEPVEDEPKPFTIDDFVAGLQEKSDAYYAEHYPMLPKPQFGYDKGTKYIRVWTDNGTQKFVHCFVEGATGHVFKAAGWKAPAKGIRFFTMQEALFAYNGNGTGYLYAK